jgi:CelD/BcsL family acetyltransferase involved in cellulose biosynthesis
MKGYSIEIIDTYNALSDFREGWDEVLAASSVDSIFLTWEWIAAWAKIFIDRGKRIFIPIVRRKGTIVCVAPWYVHDAHYGPFRVRTIEFLGTPEAGSDYMDVIAKSGKEIEAAHYLYDFLMNDVPLEWDSLLFRDVPANSIFLHKFIDKFDTDGKYVQVFRGSYCPTVKLPKTQEEFFASMRSHRRRQHNRHWRMLRNHGEVEYATVKDPHRNGRFSEFLAFYENQWGKRSGRHRAFMNAFIQLARRKDWLEVECLRQGGKYIAAILHMTYNRTKYSYLTAVDKNFNRRVSAGNVLVGLALQDAIERNMEIYNFLRGDEPYKYHWANSGEQLLHFSYQKRRIVSTVQFAGTTLKNAGKILLR